MGRYASNQFAVNASSAALGSTHKLNVAVVSTQNEWHGGEEQAALLIDGLNRRGHTCHVMARDTSEFANRMQARGLPVMTFRGRGQLPTTMWQMRRRLQLIRPDVIFYNDPHALTYAGMAAWGLSIPLRVASRRVDFPLKVVRRYRRMSDVVVCVSHAVRQVCVDCGLQAADLEVVHDGVDPQRMQGGDRRRGRGSLGVADDTTVLLTVAKLTDHKGHRFMMEAMPNIVRDFPRLQWAIAGDGPLHGQLEKQAAALGVTKHVKFLGYRHDVPDLLAAADLMIVPSHMEGLCSSIVDAMLVEVPIVATRAGGIPDLLDRRGIHQPPVGWLVPPRDAEALAKGVRDALRFPHVTARQVAQAEERARREFTAEQMVEQTLHIFRERLA
ncbi:MAG: glycosyltransferase, partial [Planctomycetales bacterium]|nr:glycosyltransferase [Planctomycetales bacterium]